MPSKCFRPISVSPESTSPISSVRKSRSTTPTIYPLLLSNLEDQIDSHEFQASCDAQIESPTGEMIRPDLGFRNDLESSEWEWRSDIPVLFDTMSTDSSSSGDSLFAQYLRSPSPTPSCSSASVVSDYSGKTPVASEGPCSSLASSMKKKLSPQQKLECELVHDTHHQSEQLRASPSRPRIRLLVNPPKPKIILHLTKPEVKPRTKRGRKRVGKRA